MTLGSGGLYLMKTIVVTLLMLVFTLLGCWHLYWSVGGLVMRTASLPSINGKPVFKPGPLLTTLVGCLLFSTAGLVAATGGLIAVPLSSGLLNGLCYVLAMVFLLRAIGDFKLVGFFKQVRDSQFARWDSLAYSPLCLVLSAGLFLIGRGVLTG